jgi:hypothetical protein
MWESNIPPEDSPVPPVKFSDLDEPELPEDEGPFIAEVAILETPDSATEPTLADVAALAPILEAAPAAILPALPATLATTPAICGIYFTPQPFLPVF